MPQRRALIRGSIHNLVRVPMLPGAEWESAQPANEMGNCSALAAGCWSWISRRGICLNLFLSELHFGSETGSAGRVRFSCWSCSVPANALNHTVGWVGWSWCSFPFNMVQAVWIIPSKNHSLCLRVRDIMGVGVLLWIFFFVSFLWYNGDPRSLWKGASKPSSWGNLTAVL